MRSVLREVIAPRRILCLGSLLHEAIPPRNLGWRCVLRAAIAALAAEVAAVTFFAVDPIFDVEL